MAVDERTIGEAMARMAARAEQVDGDRLAARALQVTVRRRRTGWGVAAVAVAATVAVGAVVVNLPGDRNETVAAISPTATLTITPVPQPSEVPRIQGLPDNTPQQFKAVRDCMPQGGPVHNMDGERRIPLHGVAEDFRWLVESRDKLGVTQLVGSLKGFVLCTPGVLDVSYPERPVFSYWGDEPPGKLAFDGPLSVDAYTLQMQSEVNPGKDGDPNFLVVAGRVTDAVRRVEIEWVNGQRKTATLGNGYFIGRLRALSKPGATFTPPEARRVTAYDADGRVLGEVKSLKWKPLGAVDEND